MDQFPRLYTQRLCLRKLEPDDILALVRLANNRKISDHVLNIPNPYSEPDAVFRISYVFQGFKNKARYVFAITLKETGEFVGEIGLHHTNSREEAQLGYWIGEPFWNHGFATEAIAAVLKFGFTQLNLKLVFATVNMDNAASAKVLLKNGFIRFGPEESVIQYRITKELFPV